MLAIAVIVCECVNCTSQARVGLFSLFFFIYSFILCFSFSLLPIPSVNILCVGGARVVQETSLESGFWFLFSLAQDVCSAV